MGKDAKLTKIEGNVINVVKQHTDKKGRIRGKNKTQTKILRGACVHHTINGKGKIKPTIGNDGKSTCTCRLCGGYFKGRPYSPEEVEKKFSGAKEVVNQMKYLAVAVKAGPEAVRFSSELGSMLEIAPKHYKKIGRVAEKAEQVRNKKKKKRGDDMSAVGSWK